MSEEVVLAVCTSPSCNGNAVLTCDECNQGICVHCEAKFTGLCENCFDELPYATDLDDIDLIGDDE